MVQIYVRSKLTLQLFTMHPLFLIRNSVRTFTCCEVSCHGLGVLSTNQISDCVNRKCLLIFHFPPQKVFIFKAADYSKPSQLWHSLSSLWSPVVQYNLPTDWLVRSTMCPRIVFVRKALLTNDPDLEPFHRP